MSDTVFVNKHRGTDFPGRCIHFAGVNFTEPEKRCKAGVRMLDVIVKQPYRYRYDGDRTVYTSNHSLPCLSEHDPMNVCRCDKKQLPSADEIAEEEAFINKRVAMLKASIPLIERIKREHKGEDWRGVEVCPVCGGKLHMTHSSFNGHVWGKCETDDCLSWME